MTGGGKFAKQEHLLQHQSEEKCPLSLSPEQEHHHNASCKRLPSVPAYYNPPPCIDEPWHHAVDTIRKPSFQFCSMFHTYSPPHSYMCTILCRANLSLGHFGTVSLTQSCLYSDIGTSLPIKLSRTAPHPIPLYFFGTMLPTHTLGNHLIIAVLCTAF